MSESNDKRPLDTDGATRLETLVESDDVVDQPSATDEALEIGSFRLIRELGSGGMGRVFLARQLDPVERDVALKVIRQRVLSQQTLARFEVERQVLAQMQHPAIAQVYDAGTTPQGFPWFAMEYVEGEPLDQFCARHRLSLDDRLELFVRICHGVQHAHQRGIIHRDLKPANILVTRIDGVPQPKIIDFGIASASRRDDDSAAIRDVAGTPQYMSPEQFADGDGIVDTRSDVYALGVILYELLVDQPPIDHRHFRRDGPLHFSDLPDTGTIAAPSNRLSSAGEQRDEVASKRSIPYRRLHRTLRGDLDAIVLKALSIEREKRYASPAEFADDIGRYQACEPVRARPWTQGYRMRRFVRRHALALGSASAILLALIAGLTAATLGMLEAQRQYDIAQTRSQELEQVAAFQQSMLEDIDPTTMGFGILEVLRDQVREGLAGIEGSGSDIEYEQFERSLGLANASDLAHTVVDEHILQRALESIDRDFVDQPLLRADLLEAVFQVYYAVGLVHALPELGERIIELRMSQLDEAALDVLKAHNQLGEGLYRTADYEQAEKQFHHVLDTLDPNRDEHQALMLKTRANLALLLVDRGENEEAIDLAAENIDLSLSGWAEDERDLLGMYGTMGYVLARSGDVENALTWFQKQLDGLREHPDVSNHTIGRSMINVSAAQGALGRLEESLATNREAAALLETDLGRRHPDTLRAMANVGNTLYQLGERDESIAVLEEAVNLRSEVMGPGHPLTLRAMLNLTSVLVGTGALDEAGSLIGKVVDQRRLLLGESHLDTLMAKEFKADILLRQGDTEAALAIIEPVYQQRLEQLGRDHNQTQDAGWVLGRTLRKTDRLDQARPLLKATLQHDFDRNGPESGTTLRKALEYYRVLKDLDQVEAAREARADYLAPIDVDDIDELDDRLHELHQMLNAVD
ncbi:serine/threonine protein kinase [Wenzhouxiangella sp. AB-CW3]|uniref:serine/threonine-protein kinase n=1 Tax=Wenzhouxiangella sp. AB-CW3 TaxID=2771012 RepID=UPI00168BB01F|nr:serine/threonine-protein kinase [Wenzhouxiangella sp. AB-CW3]QOC23417.1 serine/threonine protein kinase [Wenzhouxiangella sp. AB-CW3]